MKILVVTMVMMEAVTKIDMLMLMMMMIAMLAEKIMMMAMIILKRKDTFTK